MNLHDSTLEFITLSCYPSEDEVGQPRPFGRSATESLFMALELVFQTMEKALTWVDIVRSFTALFPSSDCSWHNKAFESICQLFILGKRAFTDKVEGFPGISR